VNKSNAFRRIGDRAHKDNRFGEGLAFDRLEVHTGRAGLGKRDTEDVDSKERQCLGVGHGNQSP